VVLQNSPKYNTCPEREVSVEVLPGAGRQATELDDESRQREDGGSEGLEASGLQCIEASGEIASP